MKISIVGTGYVGLVTGLSLAVLGHEVICVDNDQNKIFKINKGCSPFYEPGIDELLKQEVAKKSIYATDNFEKSILESSVTIIAVGTPTVNSKIDLSFIKKAAKQIGEALAKDDKYHVVVVKSTVLPGVTENTVRLILEKYSKKLAGNHFGLCMNPEFLREGCALEDALQPDRIVIGQIDEKSGKEFAKIYSKLSCPKIFTNLWTAELIKYTANSLFATLISFANEISRISESTNKIDVVDVWKGVHLDKRLSPYVGKKQIRPGILSYIFSGCGFGGSCFPKDIKALAIFAKMQKVDAKLIESVININKTQPHRLILHLKKAVGNDLKGKKIAVLGLAFKANTDDIRESSAFPIIEELILEKAKVVCHDPMVYKDNTPKQLANLNITLAKTVDEAIKNAEAVIVVTGWDEYIKLTPKFFKQNMKNAVVIDGRRIYDKNLFTSNGVIYKGIGL